MYVDLWPIKRESGIPDFRNELAKEKHFNFEESVQEGSFEIKIKWRAEKRKGAQEQGAKSKLVWVNFGTEKKGIGR